MTWLFVAIFIQALIPGGFEAHEDHQHADDVATHSTPCPDETPEGDPCSEGCDCLCCPGHARLLPAATRTDLSANSTMRSVSAPSPDLYPFELISRIFRPPRAA
jgi:hypothetical protein